MRTASYSTVAAAIVAFFPFLWSALTLLTDTKENIHTPCNVTEVLHTYLWYIHVIVTYVLEYRNTLNRS
jgi:hypothetical protein